MENVLFYNIVQWNVETWACVLCNLWTLRSIFHCFNKSMCLWYDKDKILWHRPQQQRIDICPRLSLAFGTSSTHHKKKMTVKSSNFEMFDSFKSPTFQQSHSWNESGRKFRPVDSRIVLYVSRLTSVGRKNMLQDFCLQFFCQVLEDKEISYLGKDRSNGQFAPGEPDQKIPTF